MGRFHLFQAAVERDEKNLELITSQAYGNFLRHFGDSSDPKLSALVMTEATLRERLERRRRLAERYATRLARALEKMENPHLREFALCHYLYGLTLEQIAEQSYFSVRTVCRHGKKAREELTRCLLAVMPQKKRVQGKKFYPVTPLNRKRVSMDAVNRSYARAAARRQAASIRSAYFYRQA